MFEKIDGCIVEVVGQVLELHETNVDIRTFKREYKNHSLVAAAIETVSLIQDRPNVLRTKPINLDYSKIKKRYVVTNGFINPFGCLTWTRFKIPEKFQKGK